MSAEADALVSRFEAAKLPPNTKLSAYELYALFIWAGFDRDEATTMTAISLAESGGQVDVVNSIGATGIVQIYLKVHPDVTPDQAKNPVFSARYAYRLYSGRGGKGAGDRRFYDWEAWTGPDARGNDGPWMRFQGVAMTGAAQFAASVAGAKDSEGKPVKAPDRDVAAVIIVGIYFGHALAGGLGGATTEALGVLPDVFEAGAAAAADIPNALINALGPLGTIARGIVALADWLSDRNNLFRLAKGVIGGALILIGMSVIARPAVQSTVSTVSQALPVGKIAKAVPK